MNKVSRIEWIDLMKGSLFLLVIITHFTIVPQPIRSFLDFMAPFRMPAYFFISGVLFSNKRLNTYTTFVKSKSKTLLLPYLSLSLLFLIIDYKIYFNSSYLIDDLHNIFVEGKSSFRSTPLWFVLTLYLTCLIYYPLHKFTHKTTTSFVLSVSIILVSIIIDKTNIYLPINLRSAIFALSFYTSGVLSKKIINSKILKSNITWIVLLIIYCLIKKNTPEPGFILQIQNVYIFYILAYIGVFACCSFFHNINKIHSLVNSILVNLSKNALIVLGSHCFYISLLAFSFDYFPYIKENQYIYFFVMFVLVFILSYVTAIISNYYLYFMLGKEKKGIHETLYEILSYKRKTSIIISK